MQERWTLTLTGILTIISASGIALALTGWEPESSSVYTVLGIINLTVILMIIQDGTLFKSKVFKRVLSVCAAITVIGVLWKIMHWYPASILLLTGFSSFAIAYTVWFLKKPGKTLIDFLKWGWVVLTLIMAACKIFHWPTLVIAPAQYVFQLALLLAFLRKIMIERAKLPPGQ